MGWTFCGECERQYRTPGGCKNPSCSKFDGAASDTTPTTPTPTSSSPTVPQIARQRNFGSPIKKGSPPPVTKRRPPKPPKRVVVEPVEPPQPVDTLMPLDVVGEEGSGQSMDLVCYRGEKSAWWPPPEKRLMYGMTLYDPWRVQSMEDRWKTLTGYMQKNCFGKVDSFAQHLRATGRGFALATAWTADGSFTSDYDYVIKIRHARTFYWGPRLTLGRPANFKSPSDVDDDYIILNADTITDSTILGFGHQCGTKEITFFHDMPLQNVVSCNGKPISQIEIAKREDLSFDEKIRLRKYLRD